MGVRKMKNRNSVSYRAEKKFGGERYSKNFGTRAAATKWLNKLEKKLRTKHPGSNKKKKKMTVRHALKKLVDVQKKKKRDPRTIEAYLETFNHLGPILDKNIPDLKAKQIVKCFEKIRNLTNGKHLSKSRLFKFLGRLSRALDIAAKKGIFMNNFEDAEAEIVGFIETHGRKQVEEMPYDEDALRKLLEYQAPKGKEPWWVVPITKLFLFSGKRFGEIICLTNDKICHKNKTIYISDMISGRMFHDHLKAGAKPHHIIMDKELYELICEIQKYNRIHHPGSEWLFPPRLWRTRPDFVRHDPCGYKGQPIQDSAVKKFVRIRMEDSGAGKKKIHTLRSTYATLRMIQLLREGNPLAVKVVQSELNHKYQRTTETYVRIAEDYLQDRNRSNVISSFLNTEQNAEPQCDQGNMDDLIRTLGIDPEEINWEAFKDMFKNIANLTKKAA
jgi:integrase